MASVPREYSLDEFVEFFRSASKPWVLWFGAGASMELPAGLPATRPVLHGLVEALSVLTASAVDPANRLFATARHDLGAGGRRDLAAAHRMQFEAVVGEIEAHTGSLMPRLLERIYPIEANARPNSTHQAAAALLADGVDLLVTTNFDECLEAACHGKGLDVLTPASGPFALAPQSLLKLHGTISDVAGLAATPEGLRRRATSAPWSDSLSGAVTGRQVLFVGYSFSDQFDVNPALVRAAAADGTGFFATISPRGDPREIGVPLAGFVRHDLCDPEHNVLVRVAQRTGWTAPSEVGCTQIGTKRDEIVELAQALMRAEHLAPARRMQALAALYFWIEDGATSLRLYTVASEMAGNTVDQHTLARASLRARRYGAAVRAFDRMLETHQAAWLLPSDRRSAAIREVDLLIGAGHSAKAGGRHGLAGRYYRRALQVIEDTGMEPEKLEPYFADQLMRSQAEWELAEAARSANAATRSGHLDKAESWLNRLADVEGLSLTTRPLLGLDRARVALARGRRDAAWRALDEARAEIVPWGDPHTLAVCDRLRAAANRDPVASLGLAWDAAHRHQWLEATKSLLDTVVIIGRLDQFATVSRARDVLVSGWDAAKELVA